MRLADGSRLVVKLNHSHTVANLRTYIINARCKPLLPETLNILTKPQPPFFQHTLPRPQYSSTAFALLTTFPNKELTEEGQVGSQLIEIDAI